MAKSGQDEWLAEADAILSLSTQDGRLAVVREEAEMPEIKLGLFGKSLDYVNGFNRSQQDMLDAGFVQEVQEPKKQIIGDDRDWLGCLAEGKKDHQQCTRPDVLDCHAKIGTGGRCMNGFVCPPKSEVKND
jgi:hypothetical protein